MSKPVSPYAEHPQSVLQAFCTWQEQGYATALIVLQQTEGGAVRARGALMAVREDGAQAGYMSGGCIDADLILRARTALSDGRRQSVRYGRGSPYRDLPLPCGGAIDVLILPDLCPAKAKHIYHTLQARQSLTVTYTSSGELLTEQESAPGCEHFMIRYTPRPRLRIAGRGADALALARLGQASHFEVALYGVDDQDLSLADQEQIPNQALKSPSDCPPLKDDPWTAFVLMFHDPDWEQALLSQALEGPAFYIGAVGSQSTHHGRCERLRQAGLTAQQIARIQGPVGLVPSLRHASQLAVSVLAEIIECFETRLARKAARTAILLLAAGQASRFGPSDKLLTRLQDRPLLEYAMDSVADLPFARRLAITPPLPHPRADCLSEKGWDVLANSDTGAPQSTSLKAGLKELARDPSIDQVLLLLGDMPFIPPIHLENMLDRLSPDRPCIMSKSASQIQPPALFTRPVFDTLMQLTGDLGAKHIIQQRDDWISCTLPAHMAVDIDTQADLEAASQDMPHV